VRAAPSSAPWSRRRSRHLSVTSFSSQSLFWRYLSSWSSSFRTLEWSTRNLGRNRARLAIHRARRAIQAN